MAIHHAILLFVAAFVAGALNSVAGGGGFLAFPALLFTGVPPINANATNTVALWPGTVASTAAYREDLGAVRHMMLPLVLTGVIGALLGAILLLRTPQATFLRMVPWLLLVATLMFAFSQQLTRFFRRFIVASTHTHHHATRKALFGAALLQLVIAVYIGFFGAGAGILMLAMFAMLGVESIHSMNALKTLLASVCNGVALITFVLAKAVLWPQATLMLVGAIIGGYGGAYYARRMKPSTVRAFVIVTGAAMTAYFFVHRG